MSTISTPQKFLFAPVAAIRPFLFARLFLLLLAADIWIDFLVSSAQYGVAGFDVAHFAWLDKIQPLPTAAIYIPVMVAASFALWLSALAGIHRGLLGLAFLLFTYGWAMSQHDSFQHHYLLSLMLLCVTFFPKLTTADVAADPRRPVAAWAYVMLAIQMAIVYLWTAIAKMDPAWISGHAIRRILHTDPADKTAHESVLHGLLAKTNGWSAFAVSAIVFELILVLGYLYAVGQDRRRGRTWPSAIFWLIAVMVHGGILLMNLKIGLFSYYMILAATVFLMPLPWLEKIGALVIRPALALSRINGDRLIGPSDPTAQIIQTAGISAGLVVATHFIDLPGVEPGACIAATLLLAIAVANAIARADTTGPRPAGPVIGFLSRLRLGATATPDIARQRIFAAALFALFMIAASYLGNLPYYFYLTAAQANHFVGDPHDAARFYKIAVDHAPNSLVDSQLYNNYADILQQIGYNREAIDNYQIALRINPADAYAQSNLAKLLMQTHQEDEALKHFAKAVEAKPNDAELICDFAVALQTRQKIDGAVKIYRLALKTDPNLARACNNLAWILATAKDHTPADAQEAVSLATRAAALTNQKDPLVLSTLAESYFAAGMQKEAIATDEQAIQLATAQNLPDFAKALTARLARYRQNAGN